MRIEPFRAAHLENLLLQPRQEYLRAWSDANSVQVYERSLSFSLVDEHGRTLACAGLVELWPGRANAWALLSADIGGRGMVMTTRAIKRALAISTFPRIEAYVDREFHPAQRWIQMLGFVNETPNGMRNWINGRPSDMYVRCQDV